MKKFFLSSLIAVLVLFSFSFKVKAIEFKDLAEGFNKSEYSTGFEEYEDLSMKAQNSSDKIIITYSAKDKKIINEFTYDEKNDALIFKSRDYPDEITEEVRDQIIADAFSVNMFVMYLGSLNQYSNEDMSNLFKSEELKKYTLEKDGIEVSTKEVNYSDEIFSFDNILTGLKVKLNGGFGHLTKKESTTTTGQNTEAVTTTKDEVANPSTSSEGELFLIVFGLISLITIIVGNNKLSKLKR